jgi:hypothetical protein
LIDFNKLKHPFTFLSTLNALTSPPGPAASLTKASGFCKKFQQPVFIPTMSGIETAPAPGQTFLVFISFSEIYFTRHQAQQEGAPDRRHRQEAVTTEFFELDCGI